MNKLLRRLDSILECSTIVLALVLGISTGLRGWVIISFPWMMVALWCFIARLRRKENKQR